MPRTPATETENQLAAENALHGANAAAASARSDNESSPAVLINNGEDSRHDSLLLGSIMDSTQGIVIFALDTNLCYTAFTQAHKRTMKAIWGADIEIGMNMLELITDPADRKKAKENFERTLGGERLILIEEYGDPTLLRTYYENRYSPLLNETGAVTGLSVFVTDITDLKRAEEATKTILRTTSEGFYLVDLEGQILETNDAYCSMIGYSRAELLGMYVRDIEALESPQDIDDRILRIIATGSARFESRHKRKDGSTVDVDASVNYFSGEKPGLFCFIRDITERKLVENALRESEEKYRDLFEVNKDGIAIFLLGQIGPPSTFVEVNHAAHEMLGYTREEMLKLTPMMLEPDATPGQLQLRQSRLESQGIVNFETVLRHKDGHPVAADFTAQAIQYKGKPAIMNIVRDITERKQAEEDLRASDARWRFALEGSGDGFWDWNVAEGRCFYSKRWNEMLGFAVGEIRGDINEWQNRVHPDDLAKAMTDVQAHFDGKTPYYTNEHRVRCKDGSWKWILDRGLVVERDDNGQPLRMIGTHADITDRKLAEENLQEIRDRLDLAMEQANLAYWERDTATNVFTFNDRFYKLYGTTAEREGGYEMAADVYARDFLPPEDQQIIKEHRSKRISDDVDEIKLEHRIRRRDGELRNIIVRRATVRDAEGNVKGTRGSNQDITELRQAEEALRKSEAHFRNIIELSPVPYALSDGDRNIIYLNKAFVGTFGYDLADIPTFADWWPRAYPDPEYRRWMSETWQARLERARITGAEIEPLEVNITAKNGSVKTALVSARELGGSRPGEHIIIFFDITERKHAEKRLRKSEQSLRESQAIARLGSFEFDIKNGVWTSSDILDEILGIDKDYDRSFAGWRRLIHRDWLRTIIRDISETVLQEHRRLELEFKIKRNNTGEEYWVSGIGALEYADDGQPIKLIGTISDINQRKQAEDAILKSKRQYDGLVSSIPVGVYVLRSKPDGSFTLDFASPRMAEIFGVSVEDLLEDAGLVNEAVHADERDAFAQLNEDGIKQLRPFDWKGRVIVKGQVKWLHIASSPEPLENGDVIWNGVILDITERKTAEAALSRTSQLLERTNTLAKLGGWEVNLRTMDRSWSTETCRILEIDPPVIPALSEVGTDLRFYHPDSLPVIQAAVNTGLETGDPYDLELQMVTARGKTIWIREQGFFEMADGRAVKIHGIVQDITDRRKLKADLELTEQSYSDIFNTVTEAIYVMDETGTFIDVNKGAEQMYLYSLDELIGQSPATVAAEGLNDLDKIGEMMLAVSETGTPATFEFWAKRKNGEIFPKEVIVNRGQYFGKDVLIATARDITDRKQVEKEKEQFYKFFRTSAEMMAISDPRGYFCRTNPAFNDILGYSEEELISKPFIDFVVPEDRQSTIRELAKQAETGYSLNFENRYVCKDGSVKWLSWRASYVADEGITYATARDITESKRAVDALRQSEADLNRAQELAGLGNWSWEIATGAITWSAELYRIFGVEPESFELTLRSIAGLIHPDDRRMQEQYTNEILRGNGADAFEYRVVRPDGDIRFVEVISSEAEMDPSGRPVRVAGTVQDVTDRRLAEEAIRESEFLLRESQRIAGLGSYVLDISTGIWSSSEVLDALFGIDESYVRSVEGWTNIIHPDDGAMMADYLRDEVLCGKQAFDMDYRIIRQDSGAERWVHGLGSLEFDDVGRPVKMRGTIRDITESKLAEAEIRELNSSLERRVTERTVQLEESNKELASFSYSVSHDLRAPLRGIDGFSHALAEEYGDRLDVTGREYLDRICSATHRMGELIDDLRNLSMITRAEMKREAVDLTSLARKIAGELRQREPDRNVTWQIGDGLTAEGDPALLRLALDNLIGNAWKFTGKREDAIIEFGSVVGDGQNVFYVRDNGAGFDMAYQEKLFGEFQRLHTASEFEGSGIGLATVQRVIQRHGGRVWAEGLVGDGATFYFTL